MADQLSGIAIIICIAFGVLTFILLFIFAKRQITRFALKSRRGPHVSIGIDASKTLYQEIERKLDRINQMRFEPPLLTKENEELFLNSATLTQIKPTHLYRMKVIHDLVNLDIIISSVDATKSRHQGQDVRLYFLHLHKTGPLSNLSLPVLYKFIDAYEHARHQPHDFSYEEYSQFLELLQCVKDSISKAPHKQISFAKPDVGDLHTREETDVLHSDGNSFLRRTFSSSAVLEDRNLAYETSV